MEKYTGRQIAIFTDVHGLLQPVAAILQDIRRRGITEVYSLGDNIGVGPNPSEVLELLRANGVKVINGNSEEYVVLGIEPFSAYFGDSRTISQQWTEAQLTSKQKEELAKNKHSYDLEIGGMKVGLCHFANDVRIDFGVHSTSAFQHAIKRGSPNPQKQFYYTNSSEQIAQIEAFSKRFHPKFGGFVSAKKDPLFGGKRIGFYDEIIQGHVHFRFLTEDAEVKIRTIRAAGIGYGDDPVDFASYIIIREKEVGYDVEEVLVPYDREAMLRSIDESTLPFKDKINDFVARR